MLAMGPSYLDRLRLPFGETDEDLLKTLQSRNEDFTCNVSEPCRIRSIDDVVRGRCHVDIRLRLVRNLRSDAIHQGPDIMMDLLFLGIYLLWSYRRTGLFYLDNHALRTDAALRQSLDESQFYGKLVLRIGAVR